MFTNTYLPHVGGVARSVKTLEDGCRAMGHEVRVVAPEFEGAEDSPDVLRVPAIQHFNGSDFCVRLPSPLLIREFMDAFKPDVIHSHHPFLLGDAALRESWKMRVPVVFTHHTLYERYTHYLPMDSPALKRAAIQLATEYCNLCDLVVAPSESVKMLLEERNVEVPVRVIPTGIDTDEFASGRGKRFRRQIGIPEDAKVVGHVGRLAHEKNLHYLADAAALCLERDPAVVLLVVGSGEALAEMKQVLERFHGRIFFPEALAGEELIDSYAAIDCFVFSSQTETQGMVLAEAMAAGKPVVALDGPGVREIVVNEENGKLLDGNASPEEFADAVAWVMRREEEDHELAANARHTAERYDIEGCVAEMIAGYEKLVAEYGGVGERDLGGWDRVMAAVHIEWELLAAKVSAAAAAVIQPGTEEEVNP